jgi:hypothetical protein
MEIRLVPLPFDPYCTNALVYMSGKQNYPVKLQYRLSPTSQWVDVELDLNGD